MVRRVASRAARKIPRPALRIERFILGNGLSVVLGPDRSAPAIAITVNYDVGFRSEPQGRSGFAHLFEHLMFQGSAHLEKGEADRLIQGNGGLANGSTTSDYTNFISMLPSNALELGLFLEADRMRGTRIDAENLRNQIDVVKEEIRLNVLNQPYGGFPWIDLPPVMFESFNNVHNGYGSFVDLESATVEDASDFFDTFYAPANAQLSVTGDFDVPRIITIIEKHFATIPKRPAPKLPDLSEAHPTSERRAAKYDPMAPMPALAVGYRTPDPIREMEDYCAAIVLVEVLTDGEGSRLHQRLVKEDRIASHIGGMIGTFGDPFDVRDPTMLQLMAYHPGGTADEVLRSFDDEVSRIIDDGISDEELDRVQTSLISSHLRRLDNLMARSTSMATLEQQRNRAELVNDIPGLIAAVEAPAVVAAATRWLRRDGRAVLEVRPGAGK